MKLQDKMLEELRNKKLFKQAQKYSYAYIDEIQSMDVYPSESNIDQLDQFEEPLQQETISAEIVIEMLNAIGGPGTIAQTGGRYFGFVNGGAIPVSLGVKWLTDVWDQCGGLFLTSPVNAKLESVCESWLIDTLRLPEKTVAGFVSGTSMANLCGLAAARFRVLKNLGWDFNKRGLNGAPEIRIIVHEQVHASIKKTLALLGFGMDNLEWVPSDEQGRIMVEKIPKLDKASILILQAGNANTGCFDDFEKIFSKIDCSESWVHVDGAFGLWASSVKELSYLTKGVEQANSWSIDGHKTLNTPYDSGMILCQDEEALLSALQATGEYMIFSEARDPLLYTPELSKRSRAIELWATMKYLGKQGINEMIYCFHERAKQLEAGLQQLGFEVLNEVVFNQVLICGETDEETQKLISYIQNSRQSWLGGTSWRNKAAIRISICSWMTTEQDIKILLDLFKRGREA